MSDQEKSGQPTPAPADLPAADSSPVEKSATPSGSGSAQAAPAFGVFTATRGSGLARGKRPITAAPSTRPAAPTGYKPTSLEVMKPQSEYKNPFTGETSVGAPATPPSGPGETTNEPPSAEASAKTDAAQATPPLPVSPVPESSAALDACAESSDTAPKPDMFPFPENAAKPALNILPPEPARRPDVRWESPNSGAPRSEQPRPTFQPDRERREQREKRPFEPREPREQREPRPFEPRDQPREPRNFEPRPPREPRRDGGRFEPRNPQPQPERSPRPEPVKKSGGFLGWLKSLFASDQPAPPAPSASPEGGQRREGGHGGERHHRGGRGRGGQGGYRDDRRGQQGGQFQPRGEGEQRSGEQGDRGEGQYGDGQRRRRRRGGRGRYRGDGDGGDRGPRPEGQQGGGAV